MGKIFISSRSQAYWIRTIVILLMLSSMVFTNLLSVSAATPVEVGYRDFTFPKGTGGNSEPTGEKPESKLWWNDGFWWASLWSTAGNAYRIHRLDMSTQDWVDTGVALDNRNNSRADALWDGQRLYVASHVFAANAGAPASPAERGRLYRYSYNSQSKSYNLEAGFPVEITGGKSETLVLEKDSAGTLWVTYVENQKVILNRSLNGNDSLWGTPFVLPAGGKENVSSDDIASIIAYNQHIGVMWSNQNKPKTIYFAVHPIGAPDQVWTPVKAYSLSSDDHINLKALETDSAGNVYAAIKTSSSSALIVLLVCKNNIHRCKNESDWLSYPVYTSNADSPTRPILLLDQTNREVYVFTRNKDAVGNSGIYYKKAALDSIQFSAGIGTPFIKSSLDKGVNDPTSTKQNLNSTTGLVVLASDSSTKRYLHNSMSLGSSNLPGITSFTPTEGTPGTEVTVNGSNFNGTAAVQFNGAPASGFTVVSNTQLRATVPAGATTGPISVTNASGTATSASNFSVTSPPPLQYTLTITNVGFGNVALNPPGGTYDAGTMVMLTASPDAGWSFSGWGGALSGSSNPASLTMDANKSVTATFSQTSGGGDGSVTYQETQTGGSASSANVATTASLNGTSGDLYLAAVGFKPVVGVQSVTGLGLTWTRLRSQCAGRGQTGVEIWMAQGAPGSNSVVNATLTGVPVNAVIAVSRYSGANPSNPIGNLVSGNTNGLNGLCTGGVDGNSYSFDLATTVDGALVYAAAAMRNRNHTPGSGYTERYELSQGSGGGVAGLAAEDQKFATANLVKVNGVFSGSVDWAVVGVEIRP